jgi:class 3 adenylate cyclase
VYFPQSSSNDSFRSPVIALRVRVPVSLALSKRSVPRGTRVNITARVRAGMNPGATVISALQLKVGKHWRTIRQLRFTPRSRGVTHTALRLHTPSIYRLRLRVSAQPGLSYSTGASPARALLVR